MTTTLAARTSWVGRALTRTQLPLTVVRLALAGSYLYVLLRLAIDANTGGDEWRQGDWLINSMPENLRRGPVGSVFLLAHDAIGLSPVVWVVLVQVVLLTVLYATFASHVSAIADPLLAALLAASPALFWLFWWGDVQGSVRKEMIGFAAISVLLVWVRTRRPWVLGAATALMIVGGWAHEVNVLLIPGFLYVWFSGARIALRRSSFVAPGLVLLSGFAAGIYVLVFSRATRPEAVCAAVVDRGVHPPICNGALDWIDKSPRDLVDQMRAENLSPGGLLVFMVVTVLSWAALGYLVSVATAKMAVLLTTVLTAPFVVLIIAVDWGRWVSACVFVVVAALMSRELSGGIPMARRLNPLVVLAFVVLGFLATPTHTLGVQWGGIPGQILQDLKYGAG